MRKFLFFCTFVFVILGFGFYGFFDLNVNACEICDEINVFCSIITEKNLENFYLANVQHIKNEDRASVQLPDEDIDDVISVSIFTMAGYSESINLGICKGSVKYFTLGIMYDTVSIYTGRVRDVLYGESYILFAKIFKNLIKICPRIRDAQFVRMYRNSRPAHLGDRKIHNHEYETFRSVFKIISGFGKCEQYITIALENHDKVKRTVTFRFSDYETVFSKAHKIQNLGKV